MKYLITGGCGFIGSNLAMKVLESGEELFILDNLFRQGSSLNLELLKIKGKFKFYPYDIRNQNDVERAINEIKPDYIFHLSGQVAMTTSIENPRLDFEVNAIGTFNLLEAVRKYSPNSIILYSSTNKVYGDFESLSFSETESRYVCDDHPDGFTESLPLDFHSPYGSSKGTADQYLLDYYRIYGIKTIVFRHSSMYGSNQHSTIDQGWVGWFCQKAIDIKKNAISEPFTISGNGKQVRDVLHSSDVVALYFTAKDTEKAYGQAFNIGGGIENSLSLIELFTFLESELNIHMKYININWRESDQKVFIANLNKVSNIINWKPIVMKNKGIKLMLDWLKCN